MGGVTLEVQCFSGEKRVSEFGSCAYQYAGLGVNGYKRASKKRVLGRKMSKIGAFSCVLAHLRPLRWGHLSPPSPNRKTGYSTCAKTGCPHPFRGFIAEWMGKQPSRQPTMGTENQEKMQRRLDEALLGSPVAQKAALKKAEFELQEKRGKGRTPESLGWRTVMRKAMRRMMRKAGIRVR